MYLCTTFIHFLKFLLLHDFRVFDIVVIHFWNYPPQLLLNCYHSFSFSFLATPLFHCLFFLQHFLPLYISFVDNHCHFYLSALNLSPLMLSFPDINCIFLIIFIDIFPLTHWHLKGTKLSQTLYNLQKRYNYHPDNSFRASSVWLEHQLEITHCPKFLKLMKFSWFATLHGFLNTHLLNFATLPPNYCSGLHLYYISSKPGPRHSFSQYTSVWSLLFCDKYAAAQNGALNLPLIYRGSNWKILCHSTLPTLIYHSFPLVLYNLQIYSVPKLLMSLTPIPFSHFLSELQPCISLSSHMLSSYSLLTSYGTESFHCHS